MRFANLTRGWMVVEDAGGHDRFSIPDVWRVVQSAAPKYPEGALVYIGGRQVSTRPVVPGPPAENPRRLVMARDVIATLDSWPLVPAVG